jgi:hypothetical protein
MQVAVVAENILVEAHLVGPAVAVKVEAEPVKLAADQVQELQELQIPVVVGVVGVVRVLEQDQQDHTKEATAALVLL